MHDQCCLQQVAMVVNNWMSMNSCKPLQWGQILMANLGTQQCVHIIARTLYMNKQQFLFQKEI